MDNKKNKGKLTKWLYWFLFALAVILVYKTLDNFSAIGNWIANLIDVLMPFVIGLLIAYLLYIPCRKLESIYRKSKKLKIISKRARGLSILTVYIIIIIILIVAINYLLPIVANSIIDLVSNIQGYYNSLMINIDNLPDDSIFKNEIVLDAIEGIKTIDLKQYINMNKLAEYAKGAIDFAGRIIDFFVAIIVSIYLLLERREILEFIKKLGRAILNKRAYRNFGKYFDRTNSIFFNFLAGQLLDGLIIGIITSIAMLILGVKYAISLGFMIGIFNLIPYFGAIIAVIIAAIITLLTGGLWQTVIMVIVLIILQQIDANIINPKILGNSLKISPLLVIFAVSVGGAYFGFWGMFLSVPVIAVIKLVLTDYIEYKNRIKDRKERAMKKGSLEIKEENSKIK
jgi:predicted PurR-regulated permease PerM